MSERHGGKARFHRQRQQKRLRRERTLALRKTINVDSTEPEAPRPAEVETKIASTKSA